MNRAEQRRATRARIVAAAVEAFAEHGFEGASTRDIAARADVTQGLVTYHFESKDELWKAAADEIFRALVDAIPIDPPARGSVARREYARGAIRGFVLFSAAHPEMLSFMVDAGRSDDARMRWLIETHLTPLYAFVRTIVGTGTGGRPGPAPHIYYALAGASSLIFAVPEECVALTGVDPRSKSRAERHADLVADLFAP